MASKFETFKSLHRGEEVFILPNAWDAQSAIIFQENNYKAVGTSSAAVASSLGYADGEGMPFFEYLLIVKRIVSSVNIPVTIDMEMGFGKNTDEIWSNVQRLIEAGVVGINIEDSVIDKGVRSLGDSDKFTKTLEFIKTRLSQSNQSLFINVRCDTFLLNLSNKETETPKRVKLYESAGADGIFLPCIKEESDIEKAVVATKLPLNVMVFPGLPSVRKMSELGVKRLSMGPFLHGKTYARATELAKEVIESNSIISIL